MLAAGSCSCLCLLGVLWQALGLSVAQPVQFYIQIAFDVVNDMGG